MFLFGNGNGSSRNKININYDGFWEKVSYLNNWMYYVEILKIFCFENRVVW